MPAEVRDRPPTVSARVSMTYIAGRNSLVGSRQCPPWRETLSRPTHRFVGVCYPALRSRQAAPPAVLRLYLRRLLGIRGSHITAECAVDNQARGIRVFLIGIDAFLSALIETHPEVGIISRAP